MSQILSLQIPEEMIKRLDRFAQKLGDGVTRSKASVMLLEESLRESEFSFVEFRDSPIGRQPYMKGSGLAIWEVIMLAKTRDMNPDQVMGDYPYPIENIRAAVHYYEAYRDEIDQAIADNNLGFEAIRRILPGAQQFSLANALAIGAGSSDAVSAP